MNYDIFACGVGGQGILSITDILCIAAVDNGIKVRGSETHGMSQRFGTVFATVRFGDVYSTLIAERSADVVIGMEPVETIRYSKFIKPDGFFIMNTQPIPSPASILSKSPYPSLNAIIDALKKYTSADRVIAFNATELAQNLGATIVQNIILLGALQKLPNFPLSKDSLINAIKRQLKPEFHALNEEAFEIGEQKVKELLK